jgi:hypothetical protein
MSLTALLFSAVGETRPYRQAGIHKVQVAEFYQCWCFSATGGEGDRPLSTARTGARPPLIPVGRTRHWAHFSRPPSVEVPAFPKIYVLYRDG